MEFDFFNPAAASLYWKNFSESMLSLGIDAWWLDATEPENDDLAGRSTLPARAKKVRNVYPLVVNRTVRGPTKRTGPPSGFTIDPLRFLRPNSAMRPPPGRAISVAVGSLRGKSQPGSVTPRVECRIATTDAGGFFRPGPGPIYRPRIIASDS